MPCWNCHNSVVTNKNGLCESCNSFGVCIRCKIAQRGLKNGICWSCEGKAKGGLKSKQVILDRLQGVK